MNPPEECQEGQAYQRGFAAGRKAVLDEMARDIERAIAGWKPHTYGALVARERMKPMIDFLERQGVTIP